MIRSPLRVALLLLGVANEGCQVLSVDDVAVDVPATAVEVESDVPLAGSDAAIELANGRVDFSAPQAQTHWWKGRDPFEHHCSHCGNHLFSDVPASELETRLGLVGPSTATDEVDGETAVVDLTKLDNSRANRRAVDRLLSSAGIPYTAGSVRGYGNPSHLVFEVPADRAHHARRLLGAGMEHGVLDVSSEWQMMYGDNRAWYERARDTVVEKTVWPLVELAHAVRK